MITHVQTTPTPVVDRNALDAIHDALKAKDLLPHIHLVDAGYLAADQLVASRTKGVRLLGHAQGLPVTGSIRRRPHRAGLPPRLGPRSGNLPGRASEQELAGKSDKFEEVLILRMTST
nr:hypothetical protein [Phyllobacterium endophyticum]